MKNIMKTFGALGIAFVLAACGGSSTTDSAATDEGRLITGTLDSAAAAMVVKAADRSDSCLGEVCAMVAYNADGNETQGELDPAQNRFRVRVRSGNWMFGFENGAGNRLGYLALNGITAFTVEDGDDIEIGHAMLRDGQAIVDGDVENLGVNGLHSYYLQDRDRDGIPASFDADEPAIDLSVFDVLFVRPYDAQLHVAPCRPIKVVFTKALDEATVTADTVKVALADGTAVIGTLSVWEDAEYNEYESTFAPTGGYPMGEEITLTIVSGSSGVLSKEGEALPADVTTSFTVRDFGGTSQVCHDPDAERQQIRVQERERARQSGDGGQSGSGQGQS